jgi:uncharacterized YkwD family protein
MKYNAYVLTALAQLIDIATSPSNITYTDQAAIILKLVNNERAKAGIPPLKANSDLNKLAFMKSQDIVENGYFSHHSPAYGSPFDMMKSYGINYTCAGENLAIDKCAANAHRAWMNSKTHRENILNPYFREVGIGVCKEANESYAYTQMFIGS